MPFTDKQKTIWDINLMIDSKSFNIKWFLIQIYTWSQGFQLVLYDLIDENNIPKVKIIS